ncbi:hypothetical protein MCOR07_009821 [Pyricularia oryzae]|nr:hypothetical protein MCOR01_006046 [Pyricularia oryzae]KAI6256918.1 hypothetical protein MCOR19_006618 [Pyricularia oryzae]KAI6319123.1 hypothetical protein MCOR29_005697 [Pyricularia oryzae]KAI6389957.1 hypothetical protein MCOR23_009817 [Pyricularia oryzae]KAI6416472.1 hypothetical protein MCOR20_000945 [Pyricularia oryzae]
MHVIVQEMLNHPKQAASAEDETETGGSLPPHHFAHRQGPVSKAVTLKQALPRSRPADGLTGSATPAPGQFDWFRSIGATPEAVAVLNDQPILFTILLVVLVAIILQITLIWYIHYATMKPEQKKKKDTKKPAAGKPGAKPPAAR